MRYLKINHNGKQWKQVDKRTAKKLFEAGRTLLLTPSKMKYKELYFELNKYNFDCFSPDFSESVDHYTSLNCDYENGYYSLFFIEITQ